MTLKEHRKETDAPEISPLAQDKTYGERRFDFISNFGLNFLLNLVLSAGFTYWFSHSQTPFKLPFGKEALSTSQRQEKLAEAIQKLGIMKTFGEAASAARMSVARTMANMLTLLTAGHFIVIPTVWLGAKIKPALVEKWDRTHYGDEAMEDPSIKLRHAALAAAERPTLFGTLIGRLGGIFATQATAYTIGNANNIPNMLGKKFPNKLGWLKFRGLDHFTEIVGGKMGAAVTETFPNAVGKLNRNLAHDGRYGWSNSQLEMHPELAHQTYGTTNAHGVGGGIAEHFGRYLVSDISYTAITAVSVAPAINFFKKFIPGMTYQPKITAKQQATLDAANTQIHLRAPNITGLAVPLPRKHRREDLNDEQPQTRVSDVEYRKPLAEAPEQQTTRDNPAR